MRKLFILANVDETLKGEDSLGYIGLNGRIVLTK
jgi:hypothetical protein